MLAFIHSSATAPVSHISVIAGQRWHSAICGCAACNSIAVHPARCACAFCSRTMLLATAVNEDAAEVEIPVEVEAMDGIANEDEAHNAERPARKSLKKKGPKGAPLSDFKVGDTLKGKVKTVTNYGAFIDIGAETDALLHISNLSVEFVSNVKDVIEVGMEYDVRIITIDEAKKQVALTLLTVAQEDEAAVNSARPAKRDQRQQSSSRDGPSNNNRRDDGPILKQLQEKGWDSAQFVTGTVVSTVDFGAFVRVDCSQLNSEVTGEIDGLVHISALASGRVNSVESVVKVDQQVQVRVKGIDNRKVSLTMVSVEDEKSQMESRGNSSGGGDQGFQGNKDWKEAMEKLQTDMPTFKNKPVIVDNRQQ